LPPQSGMPDHNRQATPLHAAATSSTKTQPLSRSCHLGDDRDSNQFILLRKMDLPGSA
jgi:hypothetical protein